MKHEKILFGAAVIVSWSFLTAIFLIGFGNFARIEHTGALLQNNSGGAALAGTASDASNEFLSASDVAAHNSKSNCWMTIGGKAYDMTKYIPSHPGGQATIIPYCGGDATAAFAGLPHSSNAENLLASYYIGDIGARIIPAKKDSAADAAKIAPEDGGAKADTIVSALSAPQEPDAFSAGDVGAHNSASDCWMIIGGGVYDVTSYIPYHPGGAGTITPYCGKDAAAAFDATGHSSYAEKLLASYYIGELSAAPAAQPDVAAQATQQNITAPIVDPASNSGNTASSGHTPAEISAHNSQGSCWMILGSKVYDVTSYLQYHPGGINTILPYCGKDAAAAFASIGHSSYAQQLLVSYYIGELAADGAPPNSTIQVPPPNATAPTLPTYHEEEDEED